MRVFGLIAPTYLPITKLPLTVIIVNGDEFQLVGQGAVTVVDESTATHNNLEGLLKNEAIALCDVWLHILPHGYGFNLKIHSPFL